jgi:hypothetical protein
LLPVCAYTMYWLIVKYVTWEQRHTLTITFEYQIIWNSLCKCFTSALALLSNFRQYTRIVHSCLFCSTSFKIWLIQTTYNTVQSIQIQSIQLYIVVNCKNIVMHTLKDPKYWKFFYCGNDDKKYYYTTVKNIINTSYSFYEYF